LVTFVSDIYHVRFRYLSVASQISISFNLDIITNNHIYGAILYSTKDAYSNKEYEVFYFEIF